MPRVPSGETLPVVEKSRSGSPANPPGSAFRMDDSERKVGRLIFIVLVGGLLLVAAEFDSATGGVNPETQTFATIKILNEQGVQDVSFAQQAEFLRL